MDKTSPNISNKEEAAKRLTDPALQKRAARESDSGFVCRAALSGITDPGTLLELALSPGSTCNYYALEMLRDPDALLKVMMESPERNIRRIATERLRDEYIAENRKDRDLTLTGEQLTRYVDGLAASDEEDPKHVLPELGGDNLLRISREVKGASMRAQALVYLSKDLPADRQLGIWKQISEWSRDSRFMKDYQDKVTARFIESRPEPALLQTYIRETDRYTALKCAEYLFGSRRMEDESLDALRTAAVDAYLARAAEDDGDWTREPAKNSVEMLIRVIPLEALPKYGFEVGDRFVHSGSYQVEDDSRDFEDEYVGVSRDGVKYLKLIG